MSEPDYNTFERAKEQYNCGIEMGIEDPIRFTKTDRATYHYALEVMPPEEWAGGSFLMGEPARHNNRNQPVFYAFFRYENGLYACALMTVEQFKEMQRPMLDYKGQILNVGDAVKNIESGWIGVIQGMEGLGCDLMLVCLGMNWWDGTPDEDDKQWHSPADVIKANRRDDSETTNPLNFL